MATTVSRLPTCIATGPQARANRVPNTQIAPPIAAGTTPSARSRLNSRIASEPRMAKENSAGMRRRIGPPGSQRQVSSEPRPTAASAGIPSHSVMVTTTATASAAPHAFGDADGAEV